MSEKSKAPMQNDKSGKNKGIYLSQLFNSSQLEHLGSFDVRVTGICEDSRCVKAGDMFVARDGEHFKGTEYLESAAQQGAVAVLVCSKSNIDTLSYSIPVIAIDNLEFSIGDLAVKIFENKVAKLNIIGVTGTNGKTSCAHYLAQALNYLAVNTFIIGTIGNGHPSALQEASRTTPDACSLHEMLAGFYDQGAQTVVMEVSSHALEQGRVQGIPFNVAAFTNLSRDHLDYHLTMQAYAEAKNRLFTDFGAKHLILNLDDSHNKALLQSIKKQPADKSVAVLSYSEHIESEAGLIAHNVKLQHGLAFDVVMQGSHLSISTHLLGKFNVANLLLCIGVLNQLGFNNQQIEQSIAQLKTVPGRMQNIVNPQLEDHPLCVVDYAHTPDALEKALLASRVHCTKKLYVVFGCGGDRDTGKRAEMALIAEQFADNVLVTSDNPRSENPDTIIEMIMQGFKSTHNVQVNSNREQAIEQVIAMSGKGDVVLIAGKGHEDYQEIMGVKHFFLDAQVVSQALTKALEKQMNTSKHNAQKGMLS